jgi:3-carboxy-cis,cis-muconate cycloisomerase
VVAAAEPQVARAATEALTATVGRGPAHDLVAGAVRTARAEGRLLHDVLAEVAGVEPAASDAAPDVGEAGAQVDAVLAEHRRLTEGTA